LFFVNKQQWRHFGKGTQCGTVLWEMLTGVFVRSYFQQNEFLIYFFSFLWHKIIVLISNIFIYAKITIQNSLKCTWTLQIFIHPHWYFILDTGLILRSIELFIYIQTCVNINAYPIKKISPIVKVDRNENVILNRWCP
jgi:hypothetical protein